MTTKLFTVEQCIEENIQLSAGYRDFEGYKGQTPDPQWPGQAKICVSIVLNYEEGGEYRFVDIQHPPSKVRCLTQNTVFSMATFVRKLICKRCLDRSIDALTRADDEIRSWDDRFVQELETSRWRRNTSMVPELVSGALEDSSRNVR